MVKFTEAELAAYLDEALGPAEMSAIEVELRTDRDLARRLAAINGRRDAGLHCVGDIWRRHRASCPTREQLGSFLLGALSADWAAYVQFHLDDIGCRFCQANLRDLQRQQQEANEDVATRRRRYFQSSAAYLRGGRQED